MRWLAIAVALLTLVFAGAGCGGGSSEASTDTDVVATDTIGSEDTSTDETSTDETSTEGTETDTDTSGADTDATFNFASEDCQNLVKAFVGLSAAIGAASSGQDVSGDVEKFAQYAEEVPEEIRADVKTISTAYGAFLDKLKEIGYTPGQVPTADQIQQLSDASDTVGTPEVQAASDRLSAWTTKNCSK